MTSMKLIKLFAHPYTVIISFFIILINGEGFGGFLLLYLLFGLPYGAIHSLLAVLGIVLLLFNYYKYGMKKESVLQCVIEIIGVFLLIFSLFLFFYNDKQHYNYGTFYHLVPIIMLILFGIISLFSISSNIFTIYKISTKSSIHNMNL